LVSSCNIPPIAFQASSSTPVTLQNQVSHSPFHFLSGVQAAVVVSVTGVTYLQSPRRSRGMDLFARLGRRGLEVGLLGGLQWKSVTHAAMASEHRRNQISADTM
jgi:hypothetical protein